MNQPFASNGVITNPTQIAPGDTVKVEYDGLLQRSGADSVWAFVGYGDTHNWADTSVFQMNRSYSGKFETAIPVTRPGTVSIAFKDSANNWDNNDGRNYVFPTHMR